MKSIDIGSENAKRQTERYPASERKIVIEGKCFSVNRHFTGDRPLSEIMTEMAIGRANREMDL